MYPRDGGCVVSGETMRDRFAMAALQGMLSDTSLRGDAELFAANAYKMADAMLAARGGDAPQGAGDAVKQQMLAALKGADAYFQRRWLSVDEEMIPLDTADNWRRIRAAIAAAEKEQSA